MGVHYEYKILTIPNNCTYNLKIVNNVLSGNANNSANWMVWRLQLPKGDWAIYGETYTTVTIRRKISFIDKLFLKLIKVFGRPQEL